MSLVEQRAEGIHVVRFVSADRIAVDDVEFRQSFLLLPEQSFPDHWPDGVASLTIAHLDRVLERQPELILLGSGMRQHFPRARDTWPRFEQTRRLGSDGQRRRSAHLQPAGCRGAAGSHVVLVLEAAGRARPPTD